MTTETFRRARSADHKAQRREASLAPPEQLAVRDGVRQVTLAEIAGVVGIHKSALLRYFETREEIFLELTGRAWTEWAQQCSAALAEIRAGDADSVAAVLADGFVTRPLLCVL